MHTVIIGTGSYIPEVKVPNTSFTDHVFFEKDGVQQAKSMAGVIEKFSSITGIYERRYARPEQLASDLEHLAAEAAIKNANIDRETLDYLIVAHNFGDITFEGNRSSMVPSLSSRIKALLRISNPDCIAYDLAVQAGWKG